MYVIFCLTVLDFIYVFVTLLSTKLRAGLKSKCMTHTYKSHVSLSYSSLNRDRGRGGSLLNRKWKSTMYQKDYVYSIYSK